MLQPGATICVPICIPVMHVTDFTLFFPKIDHNLTHTTA